MKVLILTPSKTIFEGEAISLQVTSIIGSFQVLDHHDTIIISLNEGNIQLDKNQEKSIDLCLKDGILEVKNCMVKILVSS